MPTTTLDQADPAALPCGERAARALGQRVAALRAALDSASACIPVEDALHGPIAGAARELEHLARDVRALVDWSLPATPRALECTLQEIAGAIPAVLPPARRATTTVRVGEPAARVRIDGPLASRALARLVEHGFALGAERAALLLASDGASFTVTAAFEGASAAEDSVSAALSGALARRDLARLGARLEFDAAARRTTIAFPAQEAAR
jgi:hypothetical protein